MVATVSHGRTGYIRAALAGGLALLAIVVSACTASSPSAAVSAQTGAIATPVPQFAGATQTSDAGQVMVAVTRDVHQATPVFNVTLDTHSVDLDNIDLSQLALLRTDQGVELQPSAWDPAPQRGHHRGGTLTFPSSTPAGAPVLGGDTRSIELVIRDVAGVPERRFEWTV